MTDHKTVREALAQMKKPEPCFERVDDYDGGYKIGFNDAIEETLAALDRIEAVETVTVAELNNLIRSEAHCYTPGMTLFVNFPNGLRIVREK